jgi:hypothetical protein
VRPPEEACHARMSRPRAVSRALVRRASATA